MSLEVTKMPLVKEVIKEFDEMEEKRREDQYKEVLERFRRNAKDGTGFALQYYNILYDEVRQRLQKEGFNVDVITSNSSGNTAYFITRNKDHVIEETDMLIKG